MKYTPFHQYKLSQLALGTIQLGMDYGIANRSGAPSREKAFSILDFARKSGINTFDTARTYGSSEEILGQYFQERSPESDLIISKFKYNWVAGVSVEQAWKETEASVKCSLQQLGVDSLPLVLYHKAPDEPMQEVHRILPKLCRRLKEAGYAERTGISLAYSREAREMPPSDDIEAFQVPLNLLDQNVVTDGTLRSLAEKGMVVFVRSVFLQGLFFRNPQELTGVLSLASPYLTLLNKLASDHQMTIAEMAFGMIRDLPEAHSMVVGAENTDQLEVNNQLLAGPMLSEALKDEIRSIAEHVPPVVITPAMWHTI
jgi:aryl-alcohol dehydrogenase-like predicted oxidoreductase